MSNIEKPCEICGKIIIVTPCMIRRNKHHYCSNKCRGISMRAVPNKACPVCGTMFVATKCREKDGRDKFCSKACAYKANGNPSVKRECLQCKKDILVEHNRILVNRGKFCSRECKGKWMSENIVGERHHNWNDKLAPEQRARERKQITGYKEWRSAVYERDNYTCQHCGNVSGNIQAHHIIPFSTDKSLRIEITNGITLCEKCHKREHKRLRSMLKGQTDFFVV